MQPADDECRRANDERRRLQRVSAAATGGEWRWRRAVGRGRMTSVVVSASRRASGGDRAAIKERRVVCVSQADRRRDATLPLSPRADRVRDQGATLKWRHSSPRRPSLMLHLLRTAGVSPSSRRELLSDHDLVSHLVVGMRDGRFAVGSFVAVGITC